jgi:L-ascorbate metabolism protein UlaG (beta-lactamase superfamily)
LNFFDIWPIVSNDSRPLLKKKKRCKMKIQLIRNATMKIAYKGHVILTDPMLSPKGAIRPFAGIARNPTVALPLPMEDILNGVEMVLVSHGHPDHIDEAAQKELPQTTPVFCQPGDEIKMAGKGFKSVIPIESTHSWEGITITRTLGEHGKGKILERMGTVSGFVLQADDEPTVYWVGDSIWCNAVEENMRAFKPDIIVTHSGGATIPGFEPIIMDIEQTLEVAAASSEEAVVVAIHMEALDHCGVSREALRRAADSKDIPRSRLLIPDDGDIIIF